MVRGFALISCLATAACLDAPERGTPDEDSGDPDRPGADSGGGGDMAGAADGGASEHVLCAGGAAADLLYASALDVPVGQANVDFAGIALLINTGTVAIDTTTFLAIADDVPGYNATPVITVGQLGDVAPVGQAVGSWSLDPDLLDPYLVEPWTDQVQPRVDLSLGYDIPGGGDFQILMVVDQDPMGGALPIDVHVAGSGTPRVVETARLPLTCTSQ